MRVPHHRSVPGRPGFGVLLLIALAVPLGSGAGSVRAQDGSAAERRPIRWLMTDLAQAMNEINDGLWREDMEMVRRGADAIARHPEVLHVEADSLEAALGPNYSAFQRYDSTMRARAEAIRQAAERGQTGSIVENYGALQETCVTCHTAFRARVQEVLYGSALAAHETVPDDPAGDGGAAGRDDPDADRDRTPEDETEADAEAEADGDADAGAEPAAADAAGPEEATDEEAGPEIPDEPTTAYTRPISGTLVEYEMRPVPGGTVTVGGADGAGEETVPARWMSTTEVTWPAYDVFVYGLDDEEVVSADAVTRPSKPYVQPGEGFGHDGYPAVGMTARAAQNYAAWLSEKTGRTYRLPTEAEWEHACKEGLGFDPARTDSLDRYAWYAANADAQTHAVASKAAGSFGLHDMLGNAAEWVIGADGDPVLKGGAFHSSAGEVGCEARMEPQPLHWKRSDPQIPKSEWWFTDAPFVTIRLVRVPAE